MKVTVEMTKQGTIYVKDDDGRSFMLQTEMEVQDFLNGLSTQAKDWIEAGWSRIVEIPDEYEFLLEHYS